MLADQTFAEECDSRSRKGAWIEISAHPYGHKYNKGRSRKGAWIEIGKVTAKWISFAVAPARERGLKLVLLVCLVALYIRRSRKGAWIEIFI